MVKRNGVFVGGYMPQEIKEFLKRRAKIEHCTVSEVLMKILKREMDSVRRAEIDRKLEHHKINYE